MMHVHVTFSFVGAGSLGARWPVSLGKMVGFQHSERPCLKEQSPGRWLGGYDCLQLKPEDLSMDHGNPCNNFAVVCESQQFYREMGGGRRRIP